MKKITKTIGVTAVIISLLASCATTKAVDETSTEASKTKTEKTAKETKPKSKKIKFDQNAYNVAYEAGDYDTCISMLNSKNDKINLIKDNLDANMLTYLKADYTGAGKGFLETYGQMQQKSSEMNAGDVMKSALTSEASVTYTGAEYERYLAWSLRLASALGNNQPDVANGIMKDYVGTFMEEIQELRAKNAELEKGSGDALESEEFKNAEKVLKAANVDLGITGMISAIPAKSTLEYKNSSFFNYLGTVAYAVNNDFDHAKEFKSTYNVDNKFVSDVVNVPKGKGRLEVIALSGTIGKRTDSNIQKIAVSIPAVPKPIYTKIAYPIFTPTKNEDIQKITVILSDGTSAETEIIENFDTAVAIDVAQKARPAAQRSVFRNVVKNSASIASLIAANEGLKKADGNPMLQKAAQVAFDKAYDPIVSAIVDTEKADIRQGEYFPKSAQVAGFSIAPGTYTITIKYPNGESKTIENIVVSEGKVSVAVSSCEK